MGKLPHNSPESPKGRKGLNISPEAVQVAGGCRNVWRNSSFALYFNELESHLISSITPPEMNYPGDVQVDAQKSRVHAL